MHVNTQLEFATEFWLSINPPQAEFDRLMQRAIDQVAQCAVKGYVLKAGQGGGILDPLTGKGA